MNIGIIFSSEASAMKPYQAMAASIRSYAESSDGLDVVQTAPDVVHVFGTFDMQTRAMLKRCRKAAVPTVLTLCGGLAAYADYGKTIDGKQPAPLRNAILSMASTVHTTGPEEDAATAAVCHKAQRTVIANAAVTTMLTEEDMCRELVALYRDTITRHEKGVTDGIARTIERAVPTLPTTAKAMLAGLLYSRYLNGRGLFTQQRHKEMAQALIATDYDEELLAQALTRTKTRKFAAALMALLDDEGLLTEGFMPVPRTSRALKLATFNL